MRIHIGCELRFEFPQTTPMIATLNVHFSRVSELERPDYLITNPSVPIEGYRDSFGNWCNRLVAPSGGFNLGTDAIIRDSGMPDPIEVNALQHQVQHLPAEVMLFLLGSRYCETDRLSDEAWRLFGNTPLGWPRVQAICDFVHNHITFGYEHSRATAAIVMANAGGSSLVAPNVLRPFLVNWAEVVRYFIRSVETDAAADGSDETNALLHRLLAYNGVRSAVSPSIAFDRTGPPFCAIEPARSL